VITPPGPPAVGDTTGVGAAGEATERTPDPRQDREPAAEPSRPWWRRTDVIIGLVSAVVTVATVVLLLTRG
jgi:hypothetical protein